MMRVIERKVGLSLVFPAVKGAEVQVQQTEVLVLSKLNTVPAPHRPSR